MKGKLTEKDIKKLYFQVEDLTDSFREFNPIIFLHNNIWFKLFQLLEKPKIIKEMINNFSYTEGGLKNILGNMEKYALVAKNRRLISGRTHQRCPYEWQLTSFGKRVLTHSNSEYKASQRLVIFRCIATLDRLSFAKILHKGSGVLSNWENGCRFIETIKTAEGYASYIINAIKIEDVNLLSVLNGWKKIQAQISEKRALTFRSMSFTERSNAGKIGGKLGNRTKKRLNLINHISKEPPTVYEELIIEYLERNNISYELHPIILNECFDFKIGNVVIEAEDKRGLGQSYYKAYRMNKKARKVKESGGERCSLHSYLHILLLK